jgi:hypothetical protein
MLSTICSWVKEASLKSPKEVPLVVAIAPSRSSTKSTIRDPTNLSKETLPHKAAYIHNDRHPSSPPFR